jgi:hypothetical protein
MIPSALVLVFLVLPSKQSTADRYLRRIPLPHAGVNDSGTVPLLPRTRVKSAWGSTSSSRRLRPFTDRQHGPSSDSSGDGTTPNVAPKYP